ncbi:MAG: hypothetical protein AAGE89_14490, partial [Pseudomonadota bacterium]
LLEKIQKLFNQAGDKIKLTFWLTALTSLVTNILKTMAQEIADDILLSEEEEEREDASEVIVPNRSGRKRFFVN